MNRILLLVALSFLAVVPLRAAENLLTNGDGHLGDAAPSGWKATDGAAMKRDQQVFVSGPSSIALVLSGSDGNVNQSLTDLGGKTVKITAKARADGASEAQVFMLVFDGAWKQLGWRQLATIPADNSWVDVSRREVFPAEAATVLFGIFGKGTGTVWLDDAVISEE
jgi:hypothetical protein